MTDEVVWLFSLLKDCLLGKSFFLCQHFMIINLPIDLSLIFLFLLLTAWFPLCVCVHV